MTNLMNILLEAKQTYIYRLKFAFEPSKNDLVKVERMLSKYDSVSFGPLKKTIFQCKPLDFPNLDAGEIFMVDVDLGRAVSQNILLYDVTSLLQVPESLVVVRSALEPLALEAELTENDIDFDEEYLPKLEDPDYKDAEKIDVSEWMGDKLADKVVADAIADYSEERTPYAEYMSASFNHFYPKAQSDVPKDKGPTKE